MQAELLTPTMTSEVLQNNESENEVQSNMDVFLSYSWDNRVDAESLNRYLTHAGFRCWFDIEQNLIQREERTGKRVGGGTVEERPRHRGLQGCKVVVACVTHSYSVSERCRVDISDACSLNKPIIPLRLDDVTWPPAGPIAEVFGKLSYIDWPNPHEIWDVSHTKQTSALMIQLNHVNVLPNGATNDQETRISNDQKTRTSNDQKTLEM